MKESARESVGKCECVTRRRAWESERLLFPVSDRLSRSLSLASLAPPEPMWSPAATDAALQVRSACRFSLSLCLSAVAACISCMFEEREKRGGGAKSAILDMTLISTFYLKSRKLSCFFRSPSLVHLLIHIESLFTASLPLDPRLLSRSHPLFLFYVSILISSSEQIYPRFSLCSNLCPPASCLPFLLFLTAAAAAVARRDARAHRQTKGRSSPLIEEDRLPTSPLERLSLTRTLRHPSFKTSPFLPFACSLCAFAGAAATAAAVAVCLLSSVLFAKSPVGVKEEETVNDTLLQPLHTLPCTLAAGKQDAKE